MQFPKILCNLSCLRKEQDAWATMENMETCSCGEKHTELGARRPEAVPRHLDLGLGQMSRTVPLPLSVTDLGLATVAPS